MNRILLPCVRLLAGALALCPSRAAAQATPAPLYSVTRLDSGMGEDFVAHPRAVNDRGEVVGYLQGGDPFRERPFHWSAATGLTVIPAVVGGAGEGWAYDVNNAGDVVGSMDGRPFLWSPAGGFRPLGIVDGRALAVNDAGVVVGEEGTITPTSSITAFRRLPDGTVRRAAVPGFQFGSAVDVNAGGDAIVRAGSLGHLWRADGGITTLPSLPGGPGITDPAALNDLGWVVGVSDGRPFLWKPDGTMLDLGILGGGGYTRAAGINNGGLVVGSSEIGAEDESRAFIWARETELSSLNDLDASGEDWIIRHAADVNESGVIVGSGWYHGRWSGFVLTPVPEPAAALLAVTGLSAALAARPTRRVRRV